MNQRISVRELGTVQETMLLPLWARAAESQRADPILRDEMAQAIVESLDYDFSRFEKETRMLRPAACVLASVLDGWTRRFLSESPDGVVVEIGAGLDTRFERLDNGRVRWFDLDLPDSIELRRRFFQETDRRRFLACSALDADWLDVVGRCQGPKFFVAEAVLMYFKEEDVRRLFAMIADRFPGSLFAFDAAGRLAQKYSRKLEAVRLTGAEFRWGIDDVREIHDWDPRFCLLEEDAVMNHHRDRFPAGARFITWLIPAWRRIFTINLVRLGSPPAG